MEFSLLLHILSDIKDKGWWEEKLSEKQQDQKLSTAVIDKSFNDFYFIDLLFNISQKCLKIVKNMSTKTSRDSRAFKHLVKSDQQIQTTLKTQEQNPENLFDKLFFTGLFFVLMSDYQTIDSLHRHWHDLQTCI